MGAAARVAGALAVAILALCAVPPAHADLAAGWRALAAGNYARAKQEWLPLAEKGDAGAEMGLGMLAELQNREEDAARWYEQAARKGRTGAQVLLAAMYAEGRGVAQDPVRAYAWFDVAARAGHPGAAKARDAVAATMNEEEIAAARAMSEKLASR